MFVIPRAITQGSAFLTPFIMPHYNPAHSRNESKFRFLPLECVRLRRPIIGKLWLLCPPWQSARSKATSATPPGSSLDFSAHPHNSRNASRTPALPAAQDNNHIENLQNRLPHRPDNQTVAQAQLPRTRSWLLNQLHWKPKDLTPNSLRCCAPPPRLPIGK